jgi:hypothetical protein
MPNGQMDLYAVIAGMKNTARAEHPFPEDAPVVKEMNQPQRIQSFIIAGLIFR